MHFCSQSVEPNVPRSRASGSTLFAGTVTLARLKTGVVMIALPDSDTRHAVCVAMCVCTREKDARVRKGSELPMKEGSPGEALL